MLLRRERPGDESGIAAVHAAAFARPEAPGVEPPEVGLVHELRASSDWIPALSIVAALDGSIAGHVVCSRATIADRYPVLGLGPLGVAPEHHGTGIGTALMHAVIAAADALDERLIALLGSVEYYERFGFEAAAEHAVTAPHDWYGAHFQVRLLTNARGDERGPFRYAAAFDLVP
ncbi:MAG TPA: N-acetyltransferase [Acidimicrobiia bacterium]|jgi:putative acetyltransferase